MIIAADAAERGVMEIQRYDLFHVCQTGFESLSASRIAASAEFEAYCTSATAQTKPTLRAVNSPLVTSGMWPKTARAAQTVTNVEQPMLLALKRTVSRLLVMRRDEQSASTTARRMGAQPS